MSSNDYSICWCVSVPKNQLRYEEVMCCEVLQLFMIGMYQILMHVFGIMMKVVAMA